MPAKFTNWAFAQAFQYYNQSFKFRRIGNIMATRKKTKNKNKKNKGSSQIIEQKEKTVG